MPDDRHEYSLEVLGTCMTNTTKDSQATVTVQCKHLWSFAQEEALVALSEKGGDGCYRLIGDPERRAMRIAARYADLYFRSFERSNKKLQFYWVAAAAFAVKDIVFAFRYAREKVLGKSNAVQEDLSRLLTGGDSATDHAFRAYCALAKGNMWLFMEIYPWLWFFLEYAFDRDGNLIADRANECVKERDWKDLHEQSKRAVEELPFGPNWFKRLRGRMAADPVYAKAKSLNDMPLPTTTDEGTGAQMAKDEWVTEYIHENIESYDNGYRYPPSGYWKKFEAPFRVMQAERKELTRLADDSAAEARLIKVRNFKPSGHIEAAYRAFIAEANTTKADEKKKQQQLELGLILSQEQANVLQPLIYDDAVFQRTLDTNHEFSRRSFGLLSPRFEVIWSADEKVTDEYYMTVFDEPEGNAFTKPVRQVFGSSKQLWNISHRMEFIDRIKDRFNELMADHRTYMEGELQKIRRWLDA